MKPLLAATLLSWSFVVHAQVFKCEDAGRVTYQSVPCAKGEGKKIVNEVSYTTYVNREINYALAQERKRMREMNRLEQQEREFVQRLVRQRQAMHRRMVSDSQVSEQHMREKENLARERGVWDAPAPGSVSRGRDEPIRGAWDAPVRGSAPRERDKTYESMPEPSVMTHCSGGFCYDNVGGVYHHHGSGSSTMTGPSGGTCVRTGATVVCH
ncbi:hypothetical protein EII18_10765 [Comamonadaceae bacterium OH3737_COT-264]|nr:hypothetical protein EII18_10765 [Comamonadaceae bacterium OH3737_COT-264]